MLGDALQLGISIGVGVVSASLASLTFKLDNMIASAIIGFLASYFFCGWLFS